MSDGSVETEILELRRSAETDLSSRIEHAMPRDPLDRVKCVRVFGDNYRCNWWSQPGGVVVGQHASTWDTVAAQRIHKSRFLHVTLVGGEMVIKEAAPRKRL